MVTVVNNPPPPDNSGGPLSMVIVLVVLVMLGFLGYIYGLPALRNLQGATPQINVPDKIDVNITTPGK